MASTTKKESSKKDATPVKKSRSKLPVIVVLLAVSAFYVDWLAFFTWTIWGVQVMTGYWDTCFHNNEFTASLFKRIEQRDLDFTRKLEPTCLLEIPAAEYSYEKLAEVSKGFTQPVLVRGLFADAPAVKNWDPEFLAQVMGDHEVNTVQNGSMADYHWVNCHKKTLAQWAKQEPMNAVFRELKANPDSLKTIIFPPASRSTRVRDREMEQTFNDLVSRDIPLARIGGGFASGVKNTVLTQLFAGNGVNTNDNTGSGWHCDMCNNFVVQVAGYKEWTFIDPMYSKYLRPTMRNGKGAISGADRSIVWDTVPYLPKQRVTLQAGDFLYNPDWHWHQVVNPKGTGFTMGVVSRECHFGRIYRANHVFTSLILGNHLVLATHDPEARQRLIAGITGASLMVNSTKST